MKNESITQVHGLSSNDLFTGFSQIIDEKINAFEKRLSNKEKPEYLSRKEVSELLNVSLVTISSWSKKGILQPHKIGGRVRFIRKQVEETLQSNS